MSIAALHTKEATSQISLDLAAVAERLRLSTVHVLSHRGGSGSGVIWSSDGLIITNAHVAYRERALVQLSDGRIMDAMRIAIDSERDLAALWVLATDLPAATVGDADNLRVGELVLAVGNPLDVVGAMTLGIIHAANASTPIQNRQKWVRADVRLAPGNSGGPLANAEGKVIGINTLIADGLALAVPSNAVAKFLKNSRWGGVKAA